VSGTPGLKPATVRRYLEQLRAKQLVSAATELTYREPLADFMRSAAQELGFGAVTINAELSMPLAGKPDFQVANSNGAPIGYGETKAPGSAADHEKVLAGEQVDRYRRNLTNLLVTDYLRFTLFREGGNRVDVTLLAAPAQLQSGDLKVSPMQAEQLGQLLAWFFSASAPSALNAEQVADGLARRASLLRASIRALLDPADPQGESLRTLHAFYRETLMSDMSEDDFADTYAQTLIFSLFLARLEGGPLTDVAAAWKAIPEDVPILQAAVQPLLMPGAALPAEMDWVLTDALHLLAATPDPVMAAIGHPAGDKPDPVLYFYENFLERYDKAERIAKGVYYTPRPLVDYLVQAVDDTLREVFGKAAGLADKDVSLLDPAVGTGTFPLAAAQKAIQNVATLLGSGSVRTVLEERVLPNFAGLEIMPAPYTIAHVKFALFARDQHVRFRDKRALIYLTNTLGDPLESPALGGMLSLFVGGLIEEAKQAERLKQSEPILVIIGNPPWSATSHNKQPQIERIFAAWKTVDGKPITDALIALNDDYLKFLRWAVWKLLEQEHAAGRGIIAFVTNHAFVNGRIHRGVRKALLNAFDDIYVFNLQGNQRLWVKGIRDEKVFPEVQQGVAMTVLVRRATTSPPAGRVHYREMRGKRADKYAAATKARLTDVEWQSVTPAAPYYSFVPATTDVRYEDWPRLADLFPVGSSGVQTQRDDLLTDISRSDLAERMAAVSDHAQSEGELRERWSINENSVWRLADQRRRFATFSETRIIPWLYRLFDRRPLYWDPPMIARPRNAVSRHLLPEPFGLGGEDRVALVAQRAGGKPVGAIASVSRGIACAHATSQWCHVYPLRLAPEPDEGGWLPIAEADWRENLDPVLAQRLRDAYSPITVEDVAWYVFGILSTPSYRERYAAELAIDHPRIPFPASREAFDAMRELGERLGAAHLLEAPLPPDGARLEGSGSGRVDEVRYEPEAASVSINRDQRFAGVRPEAWAWGQGFRPLEHFLTDRKGRALDVGQIEMFCRAVLAVEESLALAEPMNQALASVLGEPLDLARS